MLKHTVTIGSWFENGQVIKYQVIGGTNGGLRRFIHYLFYYNHTHFKDKDNPIINWTLYTAILAMKFGRYFDGKSKIKYYRRNSKWYKVKLKGFPVYKKRSQFGDHILITR
jgi:curved DNA-binding protein